MGERRETREMDRAIRAHWARVVERFEPSLPLVDRCESWVRRSEAMPTKLDVIQPAIATETREMQQPPDLEAELRQVTPQAILRDLHRPETSFSITDYDRYELGWDPGGSSVAADVRQAIVQSYRIDPRGLLATQRSIDEDLGGMRAVRAMPWSQAPRLNRPDPDAVKPQGDGDSEA